MACSGAVRGVGVGEVGHGPREFGRAVIEACTELKSMCIAH